MPVTELPTDYHDGVWNDDGHIIWRWATGGNVEITHIKSVRPGGGTRLLKLMLEALKSNPPYHSVSGFTRTCNLKAQEFYRSCGFILTKVMGVYADGDAVLFSAPFKFLCETHLEQPTS